MNILLCIDDTDSITKEISTGAIAGYIRDAIREAGLGKCSDITRHQLLIHEDIPYTSHNSSMCMEVATEIDNSAAIISLSAQVLTKHMDKESDPGLCCCIADALDDALRGRLIAYGRLAQKEVLRKEDAYAFAALPGIHLSEHGGTGQGVIGALAGVGLRLGGNDGRFKGKIKLKASRPDGFVTAEEICDYSGAAEVRDMQGNILAAEQLILVAEYAKAALVNYKKVVLVSRQEDGSYVTCTREELENRNDG